MRLFPTLSTLLTATILAMAPAMAQPLSGRVAVGPVGSGPHDRSWAPVQGAMELCRKFGNRCWITDGIEISPGNWVPNTSVIGKPVTDSAGNNLYEVTVPR